MKLRYYMRGLGVGIVVTAILMSVTLNGKTEELTDAEIIERAKALGMEEKYETTVLSDTVSENEAEEETKVAGSLNQEKDPEVPSAPVAEETEDPLQQEPMDSPTDEQMQQDTPVQEEIQEIETDVVLITVQGGDGSVTVSRKLKDAGLIDDVLVYDKFLCQNGYDKKICTGTHEIPLGASEEEIAKIITSRP